MDDTIRSLQRTIIGGAFAVLLLVAGVAAYGAYEASAQVTSGDIEAHREELKRELAAIEAQIKEQQQLLSEKQRERVSIERDVAILDAEIRRAQLEIRARDVVIEQITEGIQEKEKTVGNLDSKLVREKESLAQLLRRTNEIDNLSVVEIILGNQSLSDFFEDLDAFDTIQVSLKESFYDIEVTKTDTLAQKEALEVDRAEQLELRQLQELQKNEIERQEAQKQEILDATLGEEERYQAFINAKEQTAAEIRSQLFSLRDSAPIPFSEALELAQFASAETGVRPAFLLGILTQETNLGSNLGTGTWLVDMHPTRDRPIFQTIAANLGLDPNQIPVSAAPGYGWGGAMGPAQFIPSTWACYGGYINMNTGDCSNSARSLSWNQFWQGPWKYVAGEDRVRQAVGKGTPANPWENRDAFMASALLLRDNGAAKSFSGCSSSSDPEWCAAMRYFAGWSNADNPAYAFYGNGVMKLTREWQAQIDILQGQ